MQDMTSITYQDVNVTVDEKMSPSFNENAAISAKNVTISV
jgi:hypothetical protein